MASIEQRIAALEQQLGPEDLTVVIVRWASRLPGQPPTKFTRDGATVLPLPDEAPEAFRDRAIDQLRAGRPGLITVFEE